RKYFVHPPRRKSCKTPPINTLIHYYIRKAKFFLLNLGKMKKDKPYQSAKHTKRLRATLPALYYLRYAIVEKTKAACGNPFPAV
ncbi:hypothetical protein, partial [Phascolarctobacterium succinatutens]|uniref:hypothetical protein n=1 Tax=Phascolarctobacterium succinatutens TaxID=626940 RepID=UPI003078C43A